MVAYTNPRPERPVRRPEPDRELAGTRVSMRAGSYREEHPDGRVYMEALNEEGVKEINREVFGPQCETEIR